MKRSILILSATILLLATLTVPWVYAQNPFGTVNQPPGVSIYQTNSGNTPGSGLALLIANLLRTLIVIAGLYAVVNFLLAGYSFMSAGGDPKKIEDSWAKIYQTIIGLLFTVGAFVIAAMVSRLLFGDFGYIFQLRVFGP